MNLTEVPMPWTSPIFSQFFRSCEASIMYEESDLVSKVRENGAADLLKVLISNFFLIITVRPRPSKISPKKRGGLPSTVIYFSLLQ